MKFQILLCEIVAFNALPENVTARFRNIFLWKNSCLEQVLDVSSVLFLTIPFPHILILCVYLDHCFNRIYGDQMDEEVVSALVDVMWRLLHQLLQATSDEWTPSSGLSLLDCTGKGKPFVTFHTCARQEPGKYNNLCEQ